MFSEEPFRVAITKSVDRSSDFGNAREVDTHSRDQMRIDAVLIHEQIRLGACCAIAGFRLLNARSESWPRIDSNCEG